MWSFLIPCTSTSYRVRVAISRKNILTFHTITRVLAISLPVICASWQPWRNHVRSAGQMQPRRSLTRCLPADNRNSRHSRPMMKYAEGKVVLTASKTTIRMSYVSSKEFRNKHRPVRWCGNMRMEPERRPSQDERHGTNVPTEAPVSGRPAVMFSTCAGVFDVRGCL